jgi:hypothetical protein
MQRHFLYRTILLAVVVCLGLDGYSQQNNLLSVTSKHSPNHFPIITSNSIASLYYDKKDASVVGIAATAFQHDIVQVTGKKIIITNNKTARGPVIIAGTIGKCDWLDQLERDKAIDLSGIKGKWEVFSISNITHKGQQLLIIAGSDRRGTAYGIFHISRTMGVSPFIWWADVVPEKRTQLFVSGSYVCPPPAVKYRGIFINDEDWGLQPWAASMQDPLLKDIGPRTYTRVFELMLRLRANYIWPAMHPCTKAFYYYKDNPKVADQYAIIVGGSHCEPMLRNNVFEWAENFQHEYGQKPGEWRYDLNKNQIYTYWQDRVKEAAGYESIYTVGMRGIHDGSMPGPRDPDEKLKLLSQVISDQREIFSDNLPKPAAEVPQIFVPYKEVLSLYQRGLPLADDITIIWPDDNHGYIRQLPNERERKRSGGHGVYYHLSYWGSPHDYLWLSSISPALVAYEMSKAYYHGADRLWVFNVGDIKPAELELQFAMDMAWDVYAWPPKRALEYILEWAQSIFGEKYAAEVDAIKKEYYELAHEAKPEHLGLSELDMMQREQRLARYEKLSIRVNRLQTVIPARLRDACFQLLTYPVLGAYLMNKKIVYQEKYKQSIFAGDEKKAVAHRAIAMQAFDSIKLLTKKYNTEIAGGKWNGMMSWQPRELAIFNPPISIDSFKKAATRINTNAPPPPRLELIARINATDYKTANETGDAGIQVIKGLGLNGKGITVLPKTGDKWPQQPVNNTLFTTYETRLQPGSYVIRVRCLPLFAPASDKKLQYTIIINDKTDTVNVHSDAETATWKKNVIRGYSMGETRYDLHEETTVLIKLYINSTALVINDIEILEYR